MKKQQNMKRINGFARRCIPVWYVAVLWVLNVTGATAQYVKRETVTGFTDKVAVVYAEGIPASAIWPLGTVLTRDGATIRHQVDRGNGDNPDINSKLSARFIVAPTDLLGGDRVTWAKASGFDDSANGNLAADFASPVTGGCSTLTTGGRHWRLPTQRELQLMLLLVQGIDVIYPLNKMMGASSTEKGYWSATEESGRDAWYVAFYSPYYVERISNQIDKNYNFNVRCISDY